ncbi:MAG: MauE/DoxX family redox-associated membrane protein [Verrucomicrobiota bacterium]
MSEEGRDRTRFAWDFFVRRGLAVLAGAVFVYAGIAKVADPMRFASDINNYQIIPWAIGVRLAFYLPWLEILCGAALLVRQVYLGALSILSALMVIFIGATVAAKFRGIDITCGCFGAASNNLSFVGHLALDLALLAALIALWSLPCAWSIGIRTQPRGP